MEFLAEPLPPTLITGLVLILGGTALVNLGDLRRRKPPGPTAADR